MSDDDSLMTFFYSCPIGLIEFNQAGKIGLMNPHAMKLLIPLSINMEIENLFDILEHHAPDLRDIVYMFTADHGLVRDSYRIYVDLGETGLDGRPRVLALSIARLGPNRYTATLSDISDQVAQEYRLAQANMWSSAILDGVNSYALLAVAGDGTILCANSNFTEMTGYACDSVVGLFVDDVLHWHDAEKRRSGRIVDEFKAAARDGWVLREGWEYRLNGDRYWCQRLIVARDGSEKPGDPDKRTYSMVLRDVASRDNETADLVTMLTQDHLTGAANRMSFQKAMRRERLRWKQLQRSSALVIFDLDHFKAVNDTYGHPAGDDVLRAVAQVGLAKTTPDATFCRLGGEEFALLLPNGNLDMARIIAEELRTEISHLRIGVSKISVTASFGCSDFAEVDGSSEALIALADRRLYAAKHMGRNQVLAMG